MMKRRCSITAIVFAALFSACGGKLYEISKTDTEGIPFFPLESATFRTSIHEQSSVELAVTIRKEANNGPHEFKSIRYTESEACANLICSKLEAALSIDEAYKLFAEWLTKIDLVSASDDELNVCYEQWKKDKSGIVEGESRLLLVPPGRVSLEDSKELPMIEFREVTAQLPARKPSFININTSMTGSASASITLSETGTLTTAQADKSQHPGDHP